MRIAFVYGKGRPASFMGKSYELADYGGSEGSMIRYAFALAELGHKVWIYTYNVKPHRHRGVEWQDLHSKEHLEEIFDAVIAMRFPDCLLGMKAPIKAVFCHDAAVPNIPDFVKSGELNLIIVVSEYHKARLQRQCPVNEQLYLVSNAGINWSKYDRIDITKVAGRCIYCSIPARGLTDLLNIWPLVRRRVPWSTLHIAGSMEMWGFDVPVARSELFQLFHDLPGVKFLGFLSQDELILEQLQSQVMLLPGNPDAPETCCMAAMECAAARNALIVTNTSVLPHRVIEGYTGYVIFREDDWYEKFAKVTAQLLIDHKLPRMQWQAREAERKHDYGILVRQWESRFKEMLKKEDSCV